MSTLKNLGYILGAIVVCLVVATGAVLAAVVAAALWAIGLAVTAIAVVAYCIKAYFESVPRNKAEGKGRSSQESS